MRIMQLIAEVVQRRNICAYFHILHVPRGTNFDMFHHYSTEWLDIISKKADLISNRRGDQLFEYNF